MISPMVIALVLLTAWVVLNAALLGAVAVAHHRGTKAAAQVAPARRAPVFAAGATA
jgi:hypothetical protein